LDACWRRKEIGIEDERQTWRKRKEMGFRPQVTGVDGGRGVSSNIQKMMLENGGGIELYFWL